MRTTPTVPTMRVGPAPFTPAENRLRVPIRAGEKIFETHDL